MDEAAAAILTAMAEVEQDVIAEVRAPTAAFGELCDNLDYARNLVRGGRYLERLKVGAFDVADLYRAAWAQAVSALDHWIHRELYDRALVFAVQAALRNERDLKAKALSESLRLDFETAVDPSSP